MKERMKNLAAWAAAQLSRLASSCVGYRPDALMLAGAGAVAYGAWLIYSPAGWIIGGGFAMLVGWLDSKAAR